MKETYENGDAPALLVVGHGSRDPRGAREFHDLVGLVRRRNPSLTVDGGFIELSRPPISECVNRLAESGARNVAAVPLTLLAAGHAKDDIPATLAREKMGHPEMSFSYGRALGIRPELFELMDERISALLLEERIREQSSAFAEANPGVEVRYAGYFGPDPRLADLVVERYTEALRGDIRMNCDVCVHRVALPGFEEKVGAPATPHYHPDEPGHHHH